MLLVNSSWPESTILQTLFNQCPIFWQLTYMTSPTGKTKPPRTLSRPGLFVLIDGDPPWRTSDRRPPNERKTPAINFEFAITVRRSRREKHKQRTYCLKKHLVITSLMLDHTMLDHSNCDLFGRKCACHRHCVGRICRRLEHSANASSLNKRGSELTCERIPRTWEISVTIGVFHSLLFSRARVHIADILVSEAKRRMRGKGESILDAGTLIWSSFIPFSEREAHATQIWSDYYRHCKYSQRLAK